MPAIVVHEEPPFVELSQLTIVPLYPDKVTVPELVVAQTEVLPDTEPATGIVLTVIIEGDEYA